MKPLKYIVNSNVVFFSLLILLLLWHLFSLNISPLPWFDETFYASITQSFINGEGFYLKVCPLQTNGKEVLIYGPIYFVITGTITEILGFNIFAFRLTNLLFAIFSVVVVYLILDKYVLSKWIKRSVILLLAFDVIFLQNSHSGRMDLVALFFSLLALYVYLKKSTLNKNVIFSLIAVSLAILTTPRAAVLLLPLLLFMLFHFIKAKDWLKLSLLITIPPIIYSVWIFYAFGTINSFIEYYLGESSNSDSSLFDSFFGGNFQIQFYQWPLIFALLYFIGFQLKENKKVTKELLLFSTPILLFYLLVKDTGAYSALITPFMYILIGLGLHQCEKFNNSKKLSLNIGAFFMYVILIVNIGIFSLKTFTILISLNERDPKLLNSWTNDKLPKNQKIVGSMKYFYAANHTSSDFQYIEHGSSLKQRVKYHTSEFIPDYLFLSGDLNQHIVNEYKKYFIFQKVYSYMPETTNKLKVILNLLPTKITTGYKGRLIKVELKEDVVTMKNI